MTVKISNKIVGYRVKKADPEAAAEHQAPVHAETKPVQMNEYIERPDFLLGRARDVHHHQRHPAQRRHRP